LAPSFAVWFVGAVTTGVTLFTVKPNVVEVVVVPSSAVIVTVLLWIVPSVVLNDQLHVPLFVPVFVTVPTEAVIATLSPVSASEYVPLLLAVVPSLTVTVALFRAIVGGSSYVAR